MDQLFTEQRSKTLGAPVNGSHRMQAMEYFNWGPPTDVSAGFRLENDPDHLYLRFEVKEKNLRGLYQRFNEPVYRDSCVEFFISFTQGMYYNFEFNCIGNILAGYGKGRENRVSLGEDLLSAITTRPSLGRNRIQVLERMTPWSLDIVIPLGVFTFSELDAFTGKKARGNFYKCGDDLPEPHFLSWKKVGSATPDFHRAEYFGDIIFK